MPAPPPQPPGFCPASSRLPICMAPTVCNRAKLILPWQIHRPDNSPNIPWQPPLLLSRDLRANSSHELMLCFNFITPRKPTSFTHVLLLLQVIESELNILKQLKTKASSKTFSPGGARFSIHSALGFYFHDKNRKLLLILNQWCSS